MKKYLKYNIKTMKSNKENFYNHSYLITNKLINLFNK